ncbi:MAG TPA: hypothetical protein VGC89_22145 [Pyrinomonadaceae bacterium]
MMKGRADESLPSLFLYRLSRRGSYGWRPKRRRAPSLLALYKTLQCIDQLFTQPPAAGASKLSQRNDSPLLQTGKQ